jgi:chemotaxis protein methyltransferase CheR
MTNLQTFQKEIEISDMEMRAIQDAIFKRYGIDFYNYEPKSFKRRLQRIFRKFNFTSSMDLWAYTLKNKDFIHEFTNEVSVGLTAMFRDPEFWKRLRDILNTQYRSCANINVWHAGCSSGEEVYTLGVILNELFLHSKTKALATDISSNALDQAISGLIHETKLAEYAKNYLNYNPNGNFEGFLTHIGSFFQLHPHLYKHVTFENSNLIMDEIKGEGIYDIVFCRNVLIYFDNPAKLKVIDKFYRSLKPGGYFIVGFFDSVINLINSDQFEPYDLDNRIFRKLPK